MTEPGNKILLPNVGGHHYRSVYEKHRITSDCAYGCGCWIGHSIASIQLPGVREFISETEHPLEGGPDGIDPRGDCPKSPSVEVLKAENARQATEDIIATIRNLEHGKEGMVMIFSRGDRYQVMAQGIHPMDVSKVIEGGLAITRENIPREHQEREPN